MTDHYSHGNTYWYLQGRADQKRVDRIIAIVCLVALALFIVFGG